MSADLEPCAGCGEMSVAHPIVGLRQNEKGDFEAWPVCRSCHINPAHRHVKLVMHFFYRAMKEVALLRAGSPDIG
jgi:hypothetical protein